MYIIYASILIVVIIFILSACCQEDNAKKATRSLGNVYEFRDKMREIGTVKLNQDYQIDMNYWTTMTPSFSKLDGKGHTITLDFAYVSSSYRQLKLFEKLTSQAVYNLIIKTSSTSFTSGSLFGSVTDSYLYHVEVIFENSVALNNWSGNDGLIASEISDTTILNAGVKFIYSLSISNTETRYYSNNIGLIAGKVKGTCHFAGLYATGSINVESRSDNDNFGVFFGVISATKVVITSSVVSLSYFSSKAANANYRTGLIFGTSGGNVELDKILVSVKNDLGHEVLIDCSLFFGGIGGYNSGFLTITNSFIYLSYSTIEVTTISSMANGQLRSGGVLGENSGTMDKTDITLSIANTSVIVKFTNSAFPKASIPGFLIGFNSPTVVILNNTIFGVVFLSSSDPFEYHDVGHDGYGNVYATDTYYYYNAYGSSSVTVKHRSIKYLSTSVSNIPSYLTDFSYDSSNSVVYYSKMAHLSSYGIEDDSNYGFFQVDIQFSGITPYYYYSNNYIHVLDHIPSSISSLTSSDYYFVFMPKVVDSFSAYFGYQYECVSSNDLPLTVNPPSYIKATIKFQCKRDISFRLIVYYTSNINWAYEKNVKWNPDGSGGDNGGGDNGGGSGGDDEYDPREPFEKLITQILIYVNAGVAALIVLLSICCYFINRN